ncbi:MAG: amidohydrolase family protein [Acidobacteriota bacterium]
MASCLAATTAAGIGARDDGPGPVADHHMHLQSSRMVAVLVRLKETFAERVEPGDRAQLGGAEAVAALDAAGARKGVVVSGAYLIGSPDIRLDDELDQVRQENDWTASQAALFPSRLVGFCSVNPLKPYAEAEVARCAAVGLRGLKLHFTNSAVDVLKAPDLERLVAVMAKANGLGLPMLVHMRSRADMYGSTQARVFVERVLPAVPDVPVVIAHMAGWGGYDRATDAALGACIDACRAAPRSCQHLWFELSMSVLPATARTAPAGTSLRDLANAQAKFPEANQRLASHILALGAGRVLFGSDWPGMSPRDGFDAVRRMLPIGPDRLRTIAGNEAPYMK